MNWHICSALRIMITKRLGTGLTAGRLQLPTLFYLD